MPAHGYKRITMRDVRIKLLLRFKETNKSRSCPELKRNIFFSDSVLPLCVYYNDNEASPVDNPKSPRSILTFSLPLFALLPRSPCATPFRSIPPFRECFLLLGNGVVGATRFQTGDEQFSTPERDAVCISSGLSKLDVVVQGSR